MAYTTINKSSDHFNTKLYTGNATDDTAITGVGFTPSFLWGKNRTDAGTNHFLIDAVRGVTKELNTNNTSAEGTDATLIKSFDSDGFTLGDGSLNQSAKNFVTWNWKANGQGSSNTDGSINTTYTSANTTAGFSISQYTGTGANATVGHGLGVAPKMIITKCTSHTSNWGVYHKSIGATKMLNLNQTNAEATNNGYFNNTDPTSSVFSLGDEGNDTNGSGKTYIAYCFAPVKGYSAMGSYTGNGSATDGTFVYTGFVPAFVICKVTSTTDNWMMFTNKIGSSTDSTSGFNIHSRILEANGSGAEQSVGSGQGIDFVSNGFKIREDNGNLNGSGATYIYMAFAEAPLVGSNNIPCTAR